MKAKDLFKKPIEIKIPGSDLIINIKSELPWYDEVDMLSIKDPVEQQRFLIWKMIDSWNLTEDDGSTTPITKELTDRFTKDTVLHLYREINRLNKEKIQKKKISRKG